MHKNKSISIIIPVGRTSIVKKCNLIDILGNLLHSGLPICEIIISGEWNTSFISNYHRKIPPLITIENYSKNRSQLRNSACHKARGTHFLFLDDDTIPIVYNTLLLKFDKLSEGDILTFAHRKYLSLNFDEEKIQSLLSEQKYDELIKKGEEIKGYVEPKIISKYSYISNFGILDKETFNKINGFDENFKGWGFEDVDMMNRIVASGHRIFSCFQDAICLHIDHLVSPYKYNEANENVKYYYKKKAINNYPAYSPEFYALFAENNQYSPTYPLIDELIINIALKKIKSLKQVDTSLVTRNIYNLIKDLDVLGIGLHGSAIWEESPRDIDLCIVVAKRFFNKHFNLLIHDKIIIEIQVVSLWTIKDRIINVHKFGDQACHLYFKWRSFSILYELQSVLSTHIQKWIDESIYSLPYIISLYVGLTHIYLNKKRTLEKLSIGRYLESLSMLSKKPLFDYVDILNDRIIKDWFNETIDILSPIYKKSLKGLDKDVLLLSPPNIHGHEILTKIS